jgi:hypothetical protein
VNFKQVSFLIAALFTVANTELFSQIPTPVDIINSIYKPNPGDSTGAAFGLDGDERRKFFSKATVAMWDKADKKANPNGEDVGAIDFDISTNTQGADVKSYSIVSNTIDGKRANVVVKLELDNWIRNNPNDNIVRYGFVQEDGRWTIDDMSNSIDGKRWTLKKLLAFHLK